MRILLFALILFVSNPANALLRSGGGGGAVTDLDGTVTIDEGGTIAGAQFECLPLYPTTPDGDVVADTDLDRVTVRRAFTITSVYAHVNVTGTTDAVTIDINEAGSTILSTKLTVDATENDSSTAATAAVISDTAIAANAVVNVDVDDADGGNTAAGLEVSVCGYYN